MKLPTIEGPPEAGAPKRPLGKSLIWFAALWIGGALCFLLWRGADKRHHLAPYLYAVGLFLVGYIGFAISLFPYIVPFQMTPADAAAADNALALMLWGAIPMLPIILGYTAYVYWLFRAKVTDEATYH